MKPFTAAELSRVEFKRELHVVLNLLYYDRDLVDLVRDEEGNRYIGHFIDYDGSAEFWYLTSVSAGVLKELLKGNVDLLTAIEGSDERRVIRLTTHGRAGEIIYGECYDGREVPYDYLPARGFKFFDDKFEDVINEL